MYDFCVCFEGNDEGNGDTMKIITMRIFNFEEMGKKKDNVKMGT